MLSKATIHALADACENRKARVLVLLAAHCWLKRNELLQLTYDQVLDGNDIVGPGGIGLRFPDDVQAEVSLLKEMNPGCTLIFQSPKSSEPKPVSPTYLSRYIEAACLKLGIDSLRLEMLRQFWAKGYVEEVESDRYLDRLKDLLPFYQRNTAAALASTLGVAYEGSRGRPSKKAKAKT